MTVMRRRSGCSSSNIDVERDDPEAFQRPEQESKDKIREEKASDAAAAFVDDLLSAFEANPQQFVALAQQHGLEVVTTPFLPATGQVEGVAGVPDLVKRVFALPELGIDTVQGQDGTHYIFQTAAIRTPKGTLSREEVVAPVPEAQSRIMTLDELNAFAAQQAKAYIVTINGMDPNQGLEYKKLLRSPRDYQGRLVLMRGVVVGTGGLGVSFKYSFVTPQPEQQAFYLVGLTAQSPVHKLPADDFLLIGRVVPGAQSTGLGEDKVISVNMICGILSDAPSKRAEVRCDRVQRP